MSSPQQPASSTSPSEHPTGRRGRDRTACKQCRKAKVRCTIDRAPCARCQRLRLSCEWDTQSKRSSTSVRVRELEQEVESLRRSSMRNHSDQQPQQPQHPQLQRDTPIVTSTEDIIGPITAQSSTHSVDKSNDAASDEPFVLDHLSLTQQRAGQLFELFFSKYHPYLPFLESERKPIDYYQSSDLLFWTIVSVAVRDQPDGLHIFEGLSSFFDTSIGRLVLGSGKSNMLQLCHIQALLLISLWPWLNIHWWPDRSWMLSNLAVTAAVQIGLHHPYFESEYSAQRPPTEEVRRERLRTWCACVAINQNTAMDFGHSSLLPVNNWAIAAVCDGSSNLDVPAPIRDYLAIQRAYYNGLAQMPDIYMPGSQVNYSEHLSLVLQGAERQLINLEQTQMSLFNRMNLTAARLYLQCMYFQVDPSLSSHKAGILRAYKTATQLVNLALSESGTSPLLQYSPRTTMRMLNCAAMLMARVLHSAWSSEVSYEEGKLLFNTAALCISQQAIRFREHDTPSRFAELSHRFWEFCRQDQSMLQSPPTLQIKTRGAASIVYDSFRLVRKKAKESYNSNDTRGRSSVTSVYTGPSDPPRAASVDFQELDILDFDWIDDFTYADAFDTTGSFTSSSMNCW